MNMQNFNGYGYGAYQGYGGYPGTSYSQQPQQQVNMYAFVDGLEGAKAYQVKANSTMLLMDSQQPICYKKTVNHVGQTVEFLAFDLVPRVEKQPQQAPTQEYVTKEEFEKQIADLKALFSKGE